MKVVRTIAVVGAIAVVAAALTTGGALASAPRGLVADLQDGAGNAIGRVRFVPTDDGKISVRVAAAGLTPGFHGFHVHTTGTCDPLAEDASGNPVPYFTAGGHYNPDAAATHGAHAGDLVPMLVAGDGTAQLRFKTDRFRNRDLMDADGSAVIFHAGADNLANVPGTT
ncbi:MAG: superoxide dismutase family protein, partial [Actinomycetota bacterium]|nr:superoxide dismutase family protein [Actinomycetota bacterium]